ncbi:MAG TPA: hypothetical protein VFA38_08375, partial [Nitrospirales bacterium]|nr:hypothetical protein [Nitrospirales bacterium]
MNRESVQSVLTRQGSLSFPANTPYIKDLAAAGGRAVRTSSGHVLFYGRDGRRFLATDPEGHPLHECEWQNGTLTRARLHLEWDAWVGIVPSGLINTTALDLSRKPGWERLTAEDLRRMAAGAMQVSIDEVRFFYRDDDLVIDRAGRAAIRQRKDAFYVLDDGTFDNGARVRFMSCMGAMHWDAIDFLPVVELFQSLLPGTGSAAFELIRGLYDDQQQGSEPRPLRYRGIPTYPSEGAYRLFSNFFVPHVAAGGDPLGVFMDPPRSHEVTWLPSPDPPRRYFNPSRKLCVTIKGDAVQKVTFADDTAGLPYSASAKAPGGRRVAVKGGRLLLEDANTRMEMEASPLWGALRDVPLRGPAALPDWRDLFDGGLPEIAPKEAYGAVLLYPEDDAEIGEIES